jgi:enamine deaminase RidA (YjgF/YER057c/UK114 family)
MTIKRMSSDGEFEAKVGYCRAVVAGGFVYVSGCVGVDRATGDVPDDVTQQCRLALDIISDALADAGSSFAKAVRVTYMLPDATDFEPCWPILRAAFGENPPVATMIECGLIDRKYRIEIEVTALAG